MAHNRVMTDSHTQQFEQDAELLRATQEIADLATLVGIACNADPGVLLVSAALKSLDAQHGKDEAINRVKMMLASIVNSEAKPTLYS